MKTAVHCLLVLASCFLVSCREETSSAADEKKRLAFSPEVGERWVYRVTSHLDQSAQVPERFGQENGEGAKIVSEKIRTYKGLLPVAAGSEEKALCFEVNKEDLASELEFSLLTDEGLMVKAWQKAGKERFLIPEPILLLPSNLPPGSFWVNSLLNPNDPSGPPMFHRRMQYFGLEEIRVLGQLREAHRVKIFGKTGPLELQRDIWFVERLGFVKERTAHYSEKTRIKLVEEELIKHELPTSEKEN